MPRTASTSHQRHSRGVWLGGLTAAACLLASGQTVLLLRASTSENICVTVTVVGEEDVPLDVTTCEGIAALPPDPTPSSSSSSSALASSSASSDPASSSASSSGGGTAGGVVSTADGDAPTLTDMGGTRGPRDRQMEHTREMFRRWRENRLRGAAPTECDEPYSDVRDGDWFSGAVKRFYCKGYLDEARLFRPSVPATRAEFAVLLVKMSGWKPTGDVLRSSFDDVRATATYAPYLEEAALKGWMRGYDNCYRTKTPCFAKPGQTVTRAEAAAMLVRFFSLRETGTAEPFVDMPDDAWYREAVYVAADHCLFQGDDGRRTMRPEGLLNRAEMVTLLDRLEREIASGAACTTPDTAFSRDDAPDTILAIRSQVPRPPSYTIDGRLLLGEGCDSPSLGCITVSVMEDAGVMLASLLSFPLPDGQSLKDLSSGEPIAWFLCVLALITGGTGCSLIVFNSRTARPLLMFSKKDGSPKKGVS